jgi:CDP-diacylglycerol--glycerol-3-phosphate 3-phosphatidyltransferase
MIVAALAASIGLMAAVTVITRRPPAGPIPDLDGYLERWSAAHDGYDARPTRLLRRWLQLVHVVARPLARQGVLPDVLTAWAVVLAVAVVALAATGERWAVLGGLLLALAGFSDGLDGAVAVLTDRATRWGYVLDSVADRVTDALFLVAAWAAGAPAWLALTTGVAAFLLEYLRARAGNAGVDHVGTITLGERPQRIMCCAIALGLAGLAPERADALAGWPIAILLALSIIGLWQLARSVHRQLR